MKAVMYGAGNIGRGFIGPLFSQAGYRVTFIDVAKPVVEGLNRRGEYPVRILSNQGHRDMLISGVDAIDGGDTEAVARAIAEANIVATAVGVNVLPRIAPNLAEGIRLRLAAGGGPLNIIICENLLGADAFLAEQIRRRLSPEEAEAFAERIGLVEASIGRMVPVQTEAMQAGDPLRVCVEPYAFLPVDRDAFKGPLPDIAGLVPYSPFGYYIKRKLFVHNMGHSTCAYLGLYCGYEYIWQAIDDADILCIVHNAMLESARALALEYAVPFQDLTAHIDDLLLRFRNRALGDTCARVGADTVRKLGANDRLAGAAALCLGKGIAPLNITVGMAAALHRHLHTEKQAQTEENAAAALRNLCGLGPGHPPAEKVLERYALFAAGTRPRQLRAAVDGDREQQPAGVV